MRAHSKVLAVFLPVALAILLNFPGFLGVGEARADMSVSAVGALNLTNFSVSPASPNLSIGTGTTFGFGALASTSFIPMFSLELGALYMPHKININDTNGNLISGESQTYLEVPLLLRFTALPIVSVGAGLYYAHTLGNETLSAPGATDQSVSNATSSDFGLEASVAAGFPIFPTISVMGDLRYLFGLTNQDSTGATTTHFRDIELLVGLTFSI